MAKTEVVMIVSLLLAITLVEGYRGMVGGRRQVSDVKSNKEVQELGRFAVEEYNMGRAGEVVVFSQVIEAETQVVSGIKYYLRIQATENKLTKTFESVVVVKPWLRSKELLHFSPSSSTHHSSM